MFASVSALPNIESMSSPDNKTFRHKLLLTLKYTTDCIIESDSEAAICIAEMVMKIGEIAKRSGTGIETIRYYEREGLLLEPLRKPSGYRLYDVSTVERLEYIRRAKDLGFTLAEIRELLDLSFMHQTCCEHMRQRVESKVTDIEQKIHQLQQMKQSLEKIVEHCRVRNTAAECPLVHISRQNSAL